MGKFPARRAEEIGALRTGIDLGLTVVDTAEMYENEELVGEAVRGCRDKVFLIDKVLPGNADYRGTKRACERSLHKLGTDRIDLYLLHWKGPHPFSETLRAMLELRQEGKIRYWGVSNIDVPDMEHIRALPGGDTCAADQVLYNLKERGVEYDLVPWCAERGMPVIAYSPIGEGSLANDGLLAEIAREHGATPARIALAWTMRHPGVMAIPKAGSAAHVRDNHRSLSIELTEEDCRRLDAAFPAPEHKIPLAGW